MKKTIVVLLLMFTLIPLMGQGVIDSTAVVPQPHRPKIGVALSGGGAKGAAHIGVLKYMEEIGIPIDYITGTSIGSIIGGLYALGYTPDEMAYLIANMDWSFYMSNGVDRSYQSSSNREQNSQFLLSVPFGTGNFEKRSLDILSTLPSGVINGASLINLFNRLSIGYNDSVDFNQLPVPFACVATDILTGDSVVLRSGNFAKAIRSSMAIPGVFSPVQWDNHLLADGGLVDNFPVDVCLHMGADIVIGVDLAGKMAATPEQLKSLPQQLSQYLSIAVSTNRGSNLELCDLLIKPDVSGYNMLSFTHDAIDTMVRRGYESAKAHHEELVRLKKRLERWGEPQQIYQAPRAKYLTETDTFVLANVIYNGVSEEEEDWLKDQDGLETGLPITVNDIEDAINILTGTGAFATITYKLFETEEEYWLTHMVYSDALGRESYRLEINLEPAEPHSFAIGFRYDSEESASLLFHFGWNEQRMAGIKAALNLNLNYNFRMDVNLSYGGMGLGDINLGYRYHNSTVNVSSNDSMAFAGFVDHHNISLYLSEFSFRNFTIATGFDEDFYDNRSGFSLDNMLSNGLFHLDRTKNFFGAFLRGRYDNLDDAYFATRGFYGNFDLSWRKENRYMFNTAVDSGFAVAAASFQTYLSPTPRLTFIPQGYMRFVMGKNSPWYDNFVGGNLPGRYLDHQMPFIGFANPMYVHDYVAILRFDTRYNVFGNFYAYLMMNYMADVDVFGNLGSDYRRSFFGLGLRVAYKSVIGPISADLYWSSLFHSVGAYLNIGYVF
ncbi:MAG: patatin-like phospholipase family protein [Bacteroidales bacterium]|nr:patatin-like phospholipase family protein [Bacteroidales bacterium]